MRKGQFLLGGRRRIGIVSMLANGDTIEDLLAEYPSIKREDILACLSDSASLAEEEVSPIETLLV